VLSFGETPGIGKIFSTYAHIVCGQEGMDSGKQKTMKLFYMSPYQVSGTPPPLPFSTKPYLPQPKLPKTAKVNTLPPSAQWR